jgi:UDP:flavonoid glycosyltransferase YjiC (YdhE family)
MKPVKVLFIPHPMPSHLIPLISLARKLRKNEFTVAFLVPQELGEYVRNNNLDLIDLPGRNFDKMTQELIAISNFNADVIVDDHNFYTAFSSRVMNKPRISIVRKGTIPFENLTIGYKHSSGVNEFFESLKSLDHKGLDLWRPTTISDLFKGDINLIPSIPTLETLPPELEERGSYIYSGPLLLNDEEMAGSLSFSSDVLTALDIFLANNRNRRIVYFTKGIADPPEILNRAEYCIHSLLSHEEVAVITNVKIQGQHDKSRYFSNNFLPMNKICAVADIMIHQCGSGAYNYQLINKIPGIVLGSKCYDRDDIALRLEKIGVAAYIPADLDEQSYYNKFDEYARQLLQDVSDLRIRQKLSLEEIKGEIDCIQGAFNFESIIRQAIEKRVQLQPY